MLRHKLVPDSDTMQTRHDATFADMPGSYQNSGTGWNSIGDDETLRFFFRDRSNLVLDSVSPYRIPHIVISRAEDSWNDQYTAWQNRVDIQWQGSLTVPQTNLSDYLPPINPLLNSYMSPDNTTPLPASSPPKPVFSYSKFKRSVESASAELTQLVKNPQKARCKAVYFAASDLARSFRKRYDSHPNVISKVDPIFLWSDPAEPIIVACFGLLGTTVIDSTCPFTLPHIIINAPPPQPPQLTENNATPLTQDAAFGQRLIVDSYLVEIINSAEDWDHDHFFELSWPQSYNSGSYDESFADQMENESESRPETPAPETPVDEEEDNPGFFYVYKGNDVMVEQPTVYGFDSPLQVEADSQPYKPQRSLFFIDEDEDDLPSLDDW